MLKTEQKMKLLNKYERIYEGKSKDIITSSHSSRRISSNKWYGILHEAGIIDVKAQYQSILKYLDKFGFFKKEKCIKGFKEKLLARIVMELDKHVTPEICSEILTCMSYPMILIEPMVAISVLESKSKLPFALLHHKPEVRRAMDKEDYSARCKTFKWPSKMNVFIIDCASPKARARWKGEKEIITHGSVFDRSYSGMTIEDWKQIMSKHPKLDFPSFKQYIIANMHVNTNLVGRQYLDEDEIHQDIYHRTLCSNILFNPFDKTARIIVGYFEGNSDAECITFDAVEVNTCCPSFQLRAVANICKIPWDLSS